MNVDNIKIEFTVEQCYDWDAETREYDHTLTCYRTEEDAEVSEPWWNITIGEVKKELGRAFYNAIIREFELWGICDDEGNLWDDYLDILPKVKTDIKVRSGGETYKLFDLTCVL